MESFDASRVCKNFVGVSALRDAFLRVRRYEVCGLVGANGSGKSTFAKICTGVLRADKCDFKIDGAPTRIENTADAEKLGISLVHQNLSLVPDLTVWENIVLGKEDSGGVVFQRRKRDRERAAAALRELAQGGFRLDDKVGSLSPGQKMIIEIAKALSRSPHLLILDEPTAPLEYKQVDQLFSKIEDLRQKGVLIVFISHRIWEVTRICSNVFAFRNGETVGELDFSRDPRSERMLLPLIVGEEGLESSFEKKKVNTSLSAAGVAVRVENISTRSRLRNISFEAKRGEILGIAGLHGQGQEDLIQVLAGAVQPSGGRLYLEGEPFTGRGINNAIRHGIFLVPGERQRDGLFMENDVFFNTVLPRFPLRHDRVFPNFRELGSITDSVVGMISLIPPNRRIVVSNLSGGNQQKVVFGKWLQFAPKVLLLDDPAKGVDIGAMRYLYDLVRALAEKGTTIILYASTNEELVSHCDRVLVMFEGGIVQELEGDHLTDQNIVKHSLRFDSARTAS